MILRDPVHGLVAFEAPEEDIILALLETKEVQRLRHVQQLGLTSLAYPGATHARFSHAVGTAHVMARFVQRIRAISGHLPEHQRLDASSARQALAAALLHDIGHGPFSHLFEEAIPEGPSHEIWGARIVTDPSTEVCRLLTRLDSNLPKHVAALIRGQHHLAYLENAVSGTFDVDRCDYLLRDAHFSGVNYGRFDLDWLLRSFCLGPVDLPGQVPSLAIDGTKGLPAIESFILARLFMFQQVYFHKASRCSDWLLARILERTREQLLDGMALPHLPPAMESLMRRHDADLHDYLDLDDAVMWTTLNRFRESPDPVLGDLCRRLLDRKLLKGFELFGEQATSAGRQRCLEIAVDLCKKTGLDPKYYVGLDAPTALAFDESKGAMAVVFPGGVTRKPSEVSFLLGRLRGQNLSRPRIIYPVEIREQLERALLPRPEDDSMTILPEGTLAGGSFQLSDAMDDGARQTKADR